MAALIKSWKADTSKTGLDSRCCEEAEEYVLRGDGCQGRKMITGLLGRKGEVKKHQRLEGKGDLSEMVMGKTTAPGEPKKGGVRLENLE